jgi:antitoxin component of MazEF toxin-antitoxin module
MVWVPVQMLEKIITMHNSNSLIALENTMELMLTARGQFTFNKSLMEHLGVTAGEKVSIKKLPGGKLEIEAKRNKMSPQTLLKTLRATIKTDIKLSIDEINDVIAQGHVDAGMRGMK